MDKPLFWAAFFFAYTLQAITGFAGNIFAMPVGIATIGMSESIAVLNITGCLACGLIAVLSFRDIVWSECAKISVTMLAFMLVGIWLDTVLPLGLLQKIYAVFILVVAVKNLFFPSNRALPEWMMWTVLALAGVIQGMFVSGGALLVIYTMQKIKGKAEFRATLSMVWTVLNALYAVFSWQMGNMTADVGYTVLVCVPILVAATLLGNVIHRHISQKAFLKFTYVMLLAVGAVMLFLS